MRAGAGADVVLFATLGARVERLGGERTRRGRRRPVPAPPEAGEPEAVTVRRVTVIAGEPFSGQDEAEAWLERFRDPETAERQVAEDLRLANRAVHAHRIAAGDPYAADLSRAAARSVRLGFGSGDELVAGRWRAALTLAPPSAREKRRRMLGPQEQVTEILSGRRPGHPSEELLLRARLDLDQARPREAALQACAARAALSAELGGGAGTPEQRELLDSREELAGRLQAAALERPLDGGELASLEELVTEMERIARRRRHLP